MVKSEPEWSKVKQPLYCFYLPVTSILHLLFREEEKTQVFFLFNSNSTPHLILTLDVIPICPLLGSQCFLQEWWKIIVLALQQERCGFNARSLSVWSLCC